MTLTGVTGKIFEWEMLGDPLPCDQQEYMPYRRAMALAKSLSDGIPAMPMGRKLYLFVCAALEVQVSEVRMYSALGTPFDRYHGIDGWFEFAGRVVTFDLTCNGHKDCYKADVVIHESEMDDEGREVACSIARFLTRS